MREKHFELSMYGTDDGLFGGFGSRWGRLKGSMYLDAGVTVGLGKESTLDQDTRRSHEVEPSTLDLSRASSQQ
jgi:hypothetical protein